MVINMFSQVLKKSPLIIQKPLKNIYNSIPDILKYGSEFRYTYNMLQTAQWWTREQHEEYQMVQLSKLIEHAYNTVPYYKRIFDERNIKPKDIQSFNDLRLIPYLTKDIVKNNIEDMISSKYKKEKLHYLTTGGSTGIPMGFYVDEKYQREKEWGFVASLWKVIGYSIYKKPRCVILRGNTPYKGVYEYRGRNLILSSFKMVENNIELYLKLIEKFKPEFIYVYPSSIVLLADYMIENNIRLNIAGLKAILCSSENIYDFQREKINYAFNARVYSHYGHSECCCIAGECENNQYYHINSEYGFTELVDENDNRVSSEDETGEIVATGFMNYAMPFLRYKTEDIAVNTNQKCKCGRNYKLIKRVDGRKQEYFFDNMGNKITFTRQDRAIWSVKEKISAYQYVQNEIGKVDLLIECIKDINDRDIEMIKKEFYITYSNFRLNIRMVDHIERTKLGKFRYLQQNLKY